MTALAERPAARILLLDDAGRILLFRFDVAGRAPFWVTPGGAIDPGESFEQAARRELFEETGLDMACGDQVHRKRVEFVTVDGIPVTADERYFLVRAGACAVDTGNHTELERQVMREWRWFEAQEIAGWPEAIYPEDLVELLEALA